MKTIALIFMTAALLGAETNSAAPTIPDGAKQVEPFLYRYTDAQGKIWMYRKYPFGITKWEERTAPTAPAPNANPVGVTDLGDSFRFESRTPFGPQIWTRKKADLTADEKGFVDAAKVPAGSATRESR